MNQARQIVEALLSESTGYYYLPDARRATFNDLARATLEKDGVQLLRQVKVRKASPAEFKKAIDLSKGHKWKGIPAIARQYAPHEHDNFIIKKGEAFDPKARYLLTDGTNYVHLGFDDKGVVDYADRFGANDPENLIAFLGDMVDEHEAMEMGLFDDDDDEVEEDVAQTGGDKPPLEVDDPVIGDEEEADDQDLDDEQEYEAESLALTLHVHPLYERLEASDKAEIDKRVATALKSKETKETVTEIVKKVLKAFYQTMYTRRSFWLNEL